MAGVLIEMRAAILRRSASGSRGRVIGGLALALFVTLLAVGTLLTGLTHYHYRGAGAAVVATLSFGWLLGWVTGPLLTGDDATLRMDYFELLPIPARKLAFAMLGAAFANVSLVFSLIAFAALIALGAQSGAAAALTGAVAVLLELVLAVVVSTVAIAVFGPAVSSRRGRDFGTMVLALVITLLSLASGLVPFVAKRLTDGHSPGLTAVVEILPSGWGAVAVDAAGPVRLGPGRARLGGLVVLIGVLVLAWPPLLARRLTMTARGGGHAGHARKERAGFLLTVVLTAASGQTWSWPWVLAAEPALVIGSAGLLALIGVRSVNGPAPDGGPSPMRVLKTHAALIALPAVTLFPAVALLIAGTATHDLALRWLAVPVGLAWAAFLGWRSVQLAQQRLENYGPEIFARVRAPAG